MACSWSYMLSPGTQTFPSGECIPVGHRTSPACDTGIQQAITKKQPVNPGSLMAGSDFKIRFLVDGRSRGPRPFRSSCPGTRRARRLRHQACDWVFTSLGIGAMFGGRCAPDLLVRRHTQNTGTATSHSFVSKSKEGPPCARTNCKARRLLLDEGPHLFQVFLAIDRAIRSNQFDCSSCLDILEWIACQKDQVRALPDLDPSGLSPLCPEFSQGWLLPSEALLRATILIGQDTQALRAVPARAEQKRPGHLSPPGSQHRRDGP